ncbi:helix-turn-helix domain-containing protein, partial [Pseudomaricurvus hydrocarbonicus]
MASFEIRVASGSRAVIVKGHLERGISVAQLSECHQVSASLIYRWLRRYKAGGEAALKMGNSRPKTSPKQTPRWQENAVKALVLGGWEQRRVAETLNLPRSTVLVISRRVCGHLLYKREPVVRYEYDAVGGLIHLDIKRVARFDQPGHRVTGNRSQQSKRAGWEYVHVCVDDYSRWSYAEVLPDQK